MYLTGKGNSIRFCGKLETVGNGNRRDYVGEEGMDRETTWIDNCKSCVFRGRYENLVQ